MEETPEESLGLPPPSRRDVLAGVAAAVFAGAVPVAVAKPIKAGQQPAAVARVTLRRYMAAAAALGDGRILISGGYNTPETKTGMPRPLNSSVIYDPRADTWFEAPPMQIPRARHAAISLPDGRVAVLGGVSMHPTASVEIYDPRTHRWELGTPLTQPRYDHVAVGDGTTVYVMGGSSSAMLSGVEVYVF